MSYQIKSTPYFRRMFNNSKRNGQLQRLREEYERIQEFNDRTIELKMRQVRLKRLFREIEEIKEGGGSSSVAASAGGGGGSSPSPSSVSRSAHRHHHHHHLRLAGISPEQRRQHQRAEALIRSRELGKELSRRNAQMIEAGVGGSLRSKLRGVADIRREAQDRRERAAKRISYGNDQSRQNLQRQLKVCQRRLTAKCQPHQSPDARPNLFRPDYSNLTPNQLDMLVDEEQLAAEQRRHFREQEEDELQLAEEHYRRQENYLRLGAAVDFSLSSSEEENGQEELRFLRGEQTLSQPEDEEDEEVNERRLEHKPHTQEHFLGDHKDRLPLAEEHYGWEAAYFDEGWQENHVENGDEDMATQQMDKKEEEEQRHRQQREKTLLLPLGRFSPSSIAIETALHQHQPVLGAGALSSEQEMLTAPLAPEELTTSTRSLTFRSVSKADGMPALNNWRRVSLMLPWFKIYSSSKSASDYQDLQKIKQ
ncbi:hypothetical protein KR059_009105 [Drosophila kikkawai]|nr:hypothetical protein KR059_009105 [Drosophila kikkawai]